MNELTNYTVKQNLLEDLTTVEQTFCSMNPATDEEKSALFTAMNNPEFRLDEKINLTLYIKDVYAETVTFVNPKTGVPEQAVRIVLIDVDGKSYSCCSIGVYSSLKKLMMLYGAPTWNPPLPLIPQTVPSRTRENAKVLTIKLG